MDRDRQFIGRLHRRVGEEVVLHGWLSRIRQAKVGYRFDLHDRSGSIAATWPAVAGSEPPPPEESAVRVFGCVIRNGRSKVMLEVQSLQVLNRAEKQFTPSRSQRHRELRQAGEFKVFAVQTTLEAAMREFAIANGFVEIHTPKISGGGSESGAAVFELRYFDRPAYLVQSPQFYMQMAMIAGFDRVFEIGPVFRSEAGKSPMHATEFTVAHFEMSWVDSHRDLMEFEEGLLRFAVAAVEEEHGREIEEQFQMPLDLPDSAFPRLPIAGGDRVSSSDVEGEGSLDRLEKALVKHAKRELGHSAAFLTEYPAAARPFYTMQDDQPGSDGVLLSRSFDLLWHGIEITSGGQREHRFDRLEAQVRSAGIPGEICDDYIRPYFLEMFRDGAPPHGGFGIGVNRLLMALLGRGSVKETSFVFRGPGRCVP